MGLLSLGEPLSWSETKCYAEHVRQHGIKQFLHLYRSRKSRTDEELKWGDEIEYMVVKFDHAARKVRVSNRAEELLKRLQAAEEAGANPSCLWRPEFGAYMVEGTPGQPYGIQKTALELYLMNQSVSGDGSPGVLNGDAEAQSVDGVEVVAPSSETVPSSIMFSFLNGVEANMRARRKEVQELLGADEAVLTISSFPRLGTFDFCTPSAFVHPTHGFARSLFFPDEAIFPGHPRFRTLANNIRERRGYNVAIYLPIYKDVKTASPFNECFPSSMNVDQSSLSDEQRNRYNEVADQRQKRFGRPDYVYMDAMGFGMGCCCLQVTFQASTICEARILYDQLTPLCPVLMALSAASPVFRGYLTDVDCRWSVIASSVDDRTEAEVNGYDVPTGRECRRIPKSRFDSVDLYICPVNEQYNDVPVCFDEQYYDQLVKEGVDPLLAKHIAHLFIRDPLVLFREKIDIDDTKESDHFENIQSTNWQTMRFKPPPPNSPEIGWRVEFRPMEVQLTDTENAAFVVFIVLLTRLILSFNLDLLIPLSKVEENMKEAQKRDAAREGRFWFRRDISLPEQVLNHFARTKPDCQYTSRLSKQLSPSNKAAGGTSANKSSDIGSCCVQLTIDEIINGVDNDVGTGGGGFPGLIPLLNIYLDSMEIDAETRCTLNNYLRLISSRAKGDIPTAARIIRDYVTSHYEYEQDSIVNDTIAYDLLHQLQLLQSDQITLEDLLQIIKQQQQIKQLNQHKA